MKPRLKPILSMTDKDKARFFSKISPDPTSDCLNWQACVGSEGYGMFRVGCYDSMVHAHRVAYMLHHNVELPPGPLGDTCVLHTCDNRRCCNPAHLWLGSLDDNMKDCAAKGRIVSNGRPPTGAGELNNRAILTEADVKMIRATYRTLNKRGQKTAQYRIWAEQYGISIATIHDVLNHRSWTHI
jgi:hypothetical protein